MPKLFKEEINTGLATNNDLNLLKIAIRNIRQLDVKYFRDLGGEHIKYTIEMDGKEVHSFNAYPELIAFADGYNTAFEMRNINHGI